MAISLVQSKSAFTNAATASLTVTPNAATTAGNLLLLVVSRGAGSTDPTFTAPAGWVSLGAVKYSDGWNATSGQAWYYPNNPGGIASVTVTSSANFGASGAGELYLLEFSGVATASPLDTHNEAVASSFTTSPSISTTTTTDGDLVVGMVVNDVGHAGGTISEPASPWTGLTAATDGQGWIALGVAYQVQTTHGAISYNPTFSAANDWILWIASFKAAGGGGTPHALVGSISADVALSATLVATKPLAGSIGGGDTAISASLVATKPLVSSVAADVALAGSLVATKPLGGAIGPSDVALVGTLTVQQPTKALAAAIAADVALSAALAVTRPLAGSIAASTALAATLLVSKPLAGAIGADVSLFGTLLTVRIGPGTVTLADALLASVTLSDVATGGSVTVSDTPIGGSVALADGPIPA